MTNVYISPHADQVQDNNGVGRVIHAQYRYLPDLGINLVTDPADADVIACHIQQGDLPRVDVLHVHGLYWTGDHQSGSYQTWHHQANQRILSAARRAMVITVPSPWVAECFKRDMRIVPTVIGHGIDIDDWEPTEKPNNYILWNKNRVGDVCSPAAALALARRGLPVVSTFGEPIVMQVIGALSYDAMRACVKSAGVYLATTKETFGIGTLEAMAAGVPILGYRWGGTADLVDHKTTGYLVKPGDVDGLAEGYAWLMEHRTQIARQTRLIAAEHTWPAVMEQYAALYRRIAEERAAEQHRVSVVIANHNYGQYVGGAIISAVSQSHYPAEIIVVDDGSTDESCMIIDKTFDSVRQFSGLVGDPVSELQIITQTNQGVAAARNAGIAAATGDYIICLDADDVLAPDYIDTCRSALAADRGLGIAYTGLGYLGEDGTIGPNVWNQGFDWAEQAAPRNPPATTIHCAAMFRKSLWERAGGYQQVYAPGEDAEFWTRGLSVGFTAEQVTKVPLFGYRNHEGSASKMLSYRPIDTWHPWMRDRQYPMAAPATTQPLVRSYSDPLISVIIPVGPGHVQYLPAAIDSLLGQTFRNWEVLVVDDTGPEGIASELLVRYPFVRLCETRPYDDLDHALLGSGMARNVGLDEARAPLCLFLDADDYLLPVALESMLQVYARGEASYVYTDWYGRHADGTMEAYEAPEYSQVAWLERGQHAVTVLMATEDALALGFDDELRGWEDWDFFVKAAIAGKCGQRLASPLLVYRYDTGQRREDSLAHKDELLAALRARYAAYGEGGTAMAGCCGGNGAAIIQARQALDGVPVVEAAITANNEGVVRLEFIGPEVGAVTWHGLQGRTYRAGNNPQERYINADPADVDRLLSLDHRFRVVPGQIVQPVHQALVIAAPPTAPEPPTMRAAPLALPDEDELTPSQEAEINRQVAAQAAKQRRASR